LNIYRLNNYNKGFALSSPHIVSLEKARAKPTNETVREIKRYPLLKVIENPPFPIIVTYGDNDIYGDTSKYVRERYPKARFEIIKNCGHIPWLHNPSAFAEILADFYKLDERPKTLGN
jgi:proline iminopeptidase